MFKQFARAFESRLPLEQAIADRNRIFRPLAEPPGRRMPQLATRFAELA